MNLFSRMLATAQSLGLSMFGNVVLMCWFASTPEFRGVLCIRQTGLSLLPRLRTLSKVGQFGEWRVVLHGQGSAFAGRLCAVRKSDCAIQHAHRRLQRKASKKQMTTRPGTLEFAKYVIVFTTCSSGSTADVLRSYRMRWQIELVFKRLKTLAHLGHVPKHDERSSRAWLYGKLLVTLLAQELIRIGRDNSPSGYPLSARRTL